MHFMREVNWTKNSTNIQMQILPPYFILPLDILTYYYFLLAIYFPEDLLLVLVPIKENQTPPPCI